MTKQNLEETAYEAIMEMILTHQFKPGDFLLETELTETLHMRSRTPVRHALTQLIARGFLEKKKKKGCTIPSPTREDAREVFFAREHIEGLNAAAAAENRTVQDIQKLKKIIEKEAETGLTGNKAAYSRINEAFHTAIADISANRYLAQYSQHVFWRSSFYVFFFGSYYTEKEYRPYMLSPPQHAAILEAVEAGDPKRAQDLMRHHVRFTYEKIFFKIA